MIEVQNMTDDMHIRKPDLQGNGSISNHYYGYQLQENNNTHEEPIIASQSQYCCQKESESHLNRNSTPTVSPVFIEEPDKVFSVQRYDDYVLPSITSSDSVKAHERRDSGFHTMSRPDKVIVSNTPNGVSVSVTPENRSNTLNDVAEFSFSDSDKSDALLDIPSPNSRIRSSPLLIKKRQEQPAAQLANKLFHLDGFENIEVAQYLSKSDGYSREVAKRYLEFFDFTGKTLDEALRSFFKHFALLGETQERERVLNCFSARYIQCNPNFLDSLPDTVHKLVCAVALLNTDLHLATGNRHRMTSKQFVTNLEGMGPDSGDFPPQLLKDLYRAIKKRALPWSGTEASIQSNKAPARRQILKSPSMMKPKQNNVVARSQSNRTNRDLIKPIPLRKEEVSSISVGMGRNSKTKTLPKKQGVLWRKVVLEFDGVKTAKRKRKWKLMLVALHGLELHLAKKDSSQATKVSIHHGLAQAEAAGEATKRDWVFRVVFANRSAFLFQASSEEETKQWIYAINRNAALLSAAPLAAAIGSQRKFQRPLLPSAPSTLPLAQQMEQQKKQLVDLRKDLNKISAENDPDLCPTEKLYNSDKTEFLQSEIHKYVEYAKLLGELQSAARKHRSDLMQICEQEVKSSDSGEETQDRHNPDSHSLVSVSPSEPGASSAMPSSLAIAAPIQQSDSTGNLVDSLPSRKHSRPIPVRTVLSPTSSMPNLHPMGVGTHFAFPSVPEFSPPDQAATPLLQYSVTNGQTVKLVKSTSSSTSSHNSNHSNHVGLQSSLSADSAGRQWPSLGEEETAGYSTTGRIKNQGTDRRTGLTPSTSMDRIDVTRHQSHVTQDGGRRSSLKHRPVEMVTSLIGHASRSSPSGDLHRQALHRNASLPPQISQSPVTVSSAGKKHQQSTPPRVRGRRERQRTSRYSYLQAVHDPSQSGV